MSLQTSRRTFLTLAGASVGLLTTGLQGAKALERLGGSAPPRLTKRVYTATVVGLSGDELEVEVPEVGRRLKLKPQDFGDWTHQVGERVVVDRTSSGSRAIKPFVTTVDAPLPRWPSKVEVGSVVQVGERSARIGSESVKRTYEAIRARSPQATLHWLLIENAHTGELRVFGVIDGK
jgi:signal peptidase I